MKKPKLGINKIQSFIDFENNSGQKVRFGIEDKKFFIEIDEVKSFLTDNTGNFIANILSSSGNFDSIQTDVLTLNEKTPVNAVPADDIILTFTDGSTQGEYFEFGDDLYEIDIDATGTAQEGAIAVSLVTGSVTKEDAAAAFKIAFDASGTEDWTCVDNEDGTVTLSPATAGVINNGLVTDATNAAHASFDTATSVNGVDGTIGLKGEICVDSSYLYYCIAANTIADNNWRRISLGTAY